MYKKWAGTKTKVVTPEDPEANGLAEKFMKVGLAEKFMKVGLAEKLMKVLTKIWHMCFIENKNPQQEINNFLCQYPAMLLSKHFFSTAIFSQRLSFLTVC